MARTHRPQRAPKGKYARTGYTSPIDAALQVIGGKYKVAILYHDLERDGMIRRKVFRQVPPRVDYFLTREGRSLVPILEALCEWGKRRIGHSTQ
jgi:DNA-binding HxlR family transcriptional regulator